MKGYFIFEYIYRDADNYKSFGYILLEGKVVDNYLAEIEECLEFGEYFVAEQVGIPALYHQLWEFSNGATRADHAFHEVSGFRPATEDEAKPENCWGSASKLLAAFRNAGKRWDCSLSVHSELFYKQINGAKS
jgi:hypothetical protein